MDDITPSGAPVMDRREALRRAAIILGGVLSASTVAGVLADDRHAWAATPDSAWKPRTLSAAQSELVATLAEHIIPATDTPGACAAGVHRFIDVLLTDFYPDAERGRYLAGLATVDARALAAHGKPFVHCRRADQVRLLSAMDAEAYPPRPAVAQAGEGAAPAAPTGAPQTEAAWFWRRTKELTLTGYYTSQIGATRELRLTPWGAYHDIPYKAVGRSWA